MSNNWDKIKELFQQAAELASEERKDFLNRECAGDSALQNEVESLLESFNKTENFLETPHLKTLDLIIQDDSNALLGKRVGNYQIEKKIGDGGMAVIYSAVRIDDQFKKNVAVKFIKRGMDTDEIIKRFRTEQQALASLEHPNIARIIDGGTTENGLPYFVMELIEGVPIHEYCNINKLSTTERLKLFQRVCSAVEYAHRNLIVHRDIKMSNILVTSEGEPKLLDFGIAKLLDHSSEKTQFTRTGMRLMTLEYASPEQLQGGQITTATDIYSLGIVLFELLTDHKPFKFKNSSPAEIENVICNIIPKKPSTVINEIHNTLLKDGEKITISPETVSTSRRENFQKIKKRLNGDIDNIVLKAIKKEPERRYSSVEQLSEDIRKYFAGLPITAQKDSALYRAKKFFERHRTGSIASVIILLLLVAGSIGIIHQADIANKERDKAKIEEAKALKINSFLQEIFSSPDPSKEGKDIKVVNVLENAVKKIDVELADQPEIQAALRTTIGTTFQNLGLYNEAIVQFEKAAKTYETIFGENNTKTASSIKNLALAYHYKGRFNKADSLYEKAVNIHTKLGIRNINFAEALNDHGTLYMDRGKFDKSIENYKKALIIYKEIKDTSGIISVFNNMGISLDYKNDLNGAENLYRKAIQLTLAWHDENEIKLIHLYNNLAFIYDAKDSIKGTIEMFTKSYEIRKKLLGEDHPEFAMSAYNLGAAKFYNGDFNEAAELINKAKQIWEKSLSKNHLYLGGLYFWLGRINNQKGKPKIAENYLLKSIKIRTNNSLDNALALTESELARSYILQGKYKAAEPILLKNFALIRKEEGENHRDTKYVSGLLHQLYSEWNKPENAAQYKKFTFAK